VIRAGLVGGLLWAIAGGAGSQPADDGAALFTRCAACHLPDGAGVPGAFPALRGQIGRYARDAAGRAYLVSVVTHGLTGSVSIGGSLYAGFMPVQNLSDTEVAAVLNHLVHVIAAPRSSARYFTAAEVATLRRGRETATAQDSRRLRPDALAEGR
jgi:mono/diheme cytochrome c family protein